ncbi:hypothetical protein Mapa_005450 [Marchantia paleacea]|nr:hypothetical protein Mapa_005450 [Marchantia paleacea]
MEAALCSELSYSLLGTVRRIVEGVLEKLPTVPLTIMNHEFGIRPATVASIKPLADFFEVPTLSPDENGDMYVSSVQGKKYPVTAVMFHPEQNVFEWTYDSIPHSSAAIQLTQSIANYFISEARKSSHAPSSQEEVNDLLVHFKACTLQQMEIV